MKNIGGMIHKVPYPDTLIHFYSVLIEPNFHFRGIFASILNCIMILGYSLVIG